MKQKNNFFSICIPTWEMRGTGTFYINYTFNILAQQTFTDFEIIISDNSINDDIKDLCEQWSELLNVKYLRNENGRGFISPNLNYGLKKCTGKYIKILFQDDFLYNINSLEKIYEYIIKNTDKQWIVNACTHTEDDIHTYNNIFPRYHDKIYLGQNTISCPSVLTIKNNSDMLFMDPSLIWLNDVDYYKRCYDKFGEPGIINDIITVNRIHPNSVTNSMTQEIINKEIEQLKNKYE